MNKKRLFTFIILISVIIGWSILLYFYSPDEIVEKIGVGQGYIFIFLVGVVGGVSTLSSATFYTTVATLSAGGLNPFLIGLVGGTAVTIGDSIFYYLGYRGRSVISGRPKKYSDRFAKWINKASKKIVMLFILIYTSLPLPNDLLVIPLGFSEFRYKYAIGPLWIGNIIGVSVFAYLSIKGFSLF